MSDTSPPTEVLSSFDGTRLMTRRMGRPGRAPLVVVNAIGANLAPWRRVLVDLEREREIVTWDHRGLLDSGPPASPRLDPGAQAEDAVAVADHHGFERFVVASWSNGGRIALELASRYPERVRGLAVVCWGSGQSWLRALRRLDPWAVLPTIASVGKHLSPWLEGPFRTLASRPELAGLIRQSGIVAGTADTALLVELFRGLASCDLKTLLGSFEEVAGDAAPEVARDVDAPCLVVGGERDPFTSPDAVRELAGRLPRARVEMYARATHYLPMEYPARLSDDLRAFFREVERTGADEDR